MQSKQETVEQLSEKLSGCSIAIITNYQGLTVAQMSQLRRKLRESSVEYRVVKNTLARRAADATGKEDIKPFLEGPTAIAFASGEVTEPVKVLTDFINTSKLPLKVKGGMMDTQILSPKDINTIATIPPREVLLAQMLGGLQTPIASLLSIMNGPMAAFLRVLDGRRRQLEGN
ncbi:MAG: 50S ribosomal protein L10 [Chloroflexota bacterium]|nr:50S ribosomal protein L10 [Chloroflexota bacterium]